MRNPYFDNAKLILIFLVILGHLIEKTSLNNPVLYNVYVFIYFFHIPAFTLLSGYFSKNLSNAKQKIKRLMLYFVVFEVFYIPLSIQSGYIFLIKPYWHMWFLLSLISWNIMLPFFIKLKHPVIIAFTIGIVSGYFDNIGYFLSLSRTLVFFPFFITGYYLKESAFKNLSNIVIRIVSVIVLLLCFVFMSKLNILYQWLYGSYSYAALGCTWWYAGIYRILIYSLSSIFCIAFFTLVPRNKFSFTYMGTNTLNTYLLHGIFVLAISLLLRNAKAMLLITLAVTLTTFLTSNVINRTLEIILNPCTQLFQTPEILHKKSQKNH